MFPISDYTVRISCQPQNEVWLTRMVAHEQEWFYIWRKSRIPFPSILHIICALFGILRCGFTAQCLPSAISFEQVFYDAKKSRMFDQSVVNRRILSHNQSCKFYHLDTLLVCGHHVCLIGEEQWSEWLVQSNLREQISCEVGVFRSGNRSTSNFMKARLFRLFLLDIVRKKKYEEFCNRRWFLLGHHGFEVPSSYAQSSSSKPIEIYLVAMHRFGFLSLLKISSWSRFFAIPFSCLLSLSCERKWFASACWSSAEG